MLNARLRWSGTALAVCLTAGLAVGCGGGNTGPTAVVPEVRADSYLFAQGVRSLERKRWLAAREYFRRLVDTYPTSVHRQDAKLGIGDSYLGENRVESDVLAVGEFREFLRFYPLAARADYAQYRLAYAQSEQILAPERDQTATLDTLREIRTFINSYPNSRYISDVLALERKTRDRLSESEFIVGRHYVRARWYPGAVARLEAVLKDDPAYTGRDGVYFYLGEAYTKLNRPADARGFFQKVIEEFRASEYRADAEKRIALLDTLPATPEPATTPASAATTGALPAAIAAPQPPAAETTPAPATPPASNPR